MHLPEPPLHRAEHLGRGGAQVHLGGCAIPVSGRTGKQLGHAPA
jgi:hypothetical protein